MRRIFSILLVLTCMSCSSTDGDLACPSREKIFVLSTTAMIDDLVGRIGGEDIAHAALVKGEMDPHSYELVKGDDERIAGAALVIGNGLNLEHGASLRFHLQSHPHGLLLGEEIQKRVPHQILYTDGELDPHLWMDISLWAEGVEPIVEALSEINPGGAAGYEVRGAALKAELLAAHEEIREMLGQIPEGRKYLVTSHDAFHYFARAYLGDKERCIAPEGLAPEGQLSLVDIQRVVAHLCAHQIEVVFPEANVNRAALKKIVSSCTKKGLEVRICSTPLYGDSMSCKGSFADTYLGMLQHNARVLKEEWQR